MGRIRAILLLATITTALAFAGYFTVYLLWKDLRPWRHYRVSFARTGGLHKDDDVFIYGLIVGRVYKIQLQGDLQIVELEIEPTSALYRDGTRVWIESIDAFGHMAIFIDPGDPSTLITYGFDDEIPGDPYGGVNVASSEETGGSAQLSLALRELEYTTDQLQNVDSGLTGRVLNDPDLANEMRDGLESLHRSVADFNESARQFLEGDEGMSALLSSDDEQRIVDGTRRIRDSLEPIRNGWREAATGGEGSAGRFAGDPSVRDSTLEGFRTLSQSLKRYRVGDTPEGPGFFSFSHAPEPAERLADAIDAVQQDIEGAVHGEGALGGLFGPGTGPATREALANLGHALENARTSDASTGSLFSPSVESRRRVVEDPVSRIEDTLREMRGALGRLRATQAPNTFQGAVFSVF